MKYRPVSYKALIARKTGHQCKHLLDIGQLSINCDFYKLNYSMKLDTSYFFATNGGPTSKTTLRFSFKTLPNDSTFGWNGKISGMSVYYSQYLDSRITYDKSLLLTTDLIPIVRFTNEKRTFLGAPYIDCTNSNVTNHYPSKDQIGLVQCLSSFSQRICLQGKVKQRL